MEAKHSLCKHHPSCFINALKGYFRGACIGLIIRAGITVLSALIKRTIFKNPSVLLKMFTKDNLRVVGFLSGMIGVYRTIICIARRLTNDEKISSFLAGFCSSVPLLFEHKGSRLIYSLYLLVRSGETVVNYLIDQEALPTIPGFYNILYAISWFVLAYSKAWHSDCLSHAISNLFMSIMKEPNDFLLLDMVGYTDKHHLKRR